MSEEINSRNAIGFVVEPSYLESVISRTEHRYEVEVDEDTYQALLETTEDGDIIIMSDEVPDGSVGCYFHNGGDFPFMIRRFLEYLVFSDGSRQEAVRIKYTKTKVSKRIRFTECDEAVEDENGDCCVWKIVFGIETLTK
ncbi:MAG: hypothetical protein MJY59_02940 [Bacteroidaceae bacterium]|nr:hypothetical protein [Bacteroidaceae bacterium]